MSASARFRTSPLERGRHRSTLRALVVAGVLLSSVVIAAASSSAPITAVTVDLSQSPGSLQVEMALEPANGDGQVTIKLPPGASSVKLKEGDYFYSAGINGWGLLNPAYLAHFRASGMVKILNARNPDEVEIKVAGAGRVRTTWTPNPNAGDVSLVESGGTAVPMVIVASGDNDSSPFLPSGAPVVLQNGESYFVLPPNIKSLPNPGFTATYTTSSNLEVIPLTPSSNVYGKDSVEFTFINNEQPATVNLTWVSASSPPSTNLRS